MRFLRNTRGVLAGVVVLVLSMAATTAARDQQAVAISNAKVSLAGTSNVHDYEAATTIVRVTRAKIAANVTDAAFLENVVKPGSFEAFEFTIPVLTLKSGKDGLDKNMYKALKAEQCPDIIVRIRKIEATATPGIMRATAALTIAGVEREVALDFKTQQLGPTLLIKGELPILMTDYGIKPPTALLGTIRASAKITVSFEAALTTAPTL